MVKTEMGFVSEATASQNDRNYESGQSRSIYGRKHSGCGIAWHCHLRHLGFQNGSR
jgi:hypothetical protein